MPPPRDFRGTLDLSDNSYEATFNATIEAQDYARDREHVSVDTFAFYRITGLEAWRRLSVTPRSGAEIQPRTIRDGRVFDECEHNHLSYGVWRRMRTSGEYAFADGGTMSGIRNEDGECLLRVDNNLMMLVGRLFGWGNEFSALFRDIPAVYDPDEIVVGISAPTHGGGTCGDFQCFEPVSIDVCVTNEPGGCPGPEQPTPNPPINLNTD